MPHAPTETAHDAHGGRGYSDDLPSLPQARLRSRPRRLLGIQRLRTSLVATLQPDGRVSAGEEGREGMSRRPRRTEAELAVLYRRWCAGESLRMLDPVCNETLSYAFRRRGWPPARARGDNRGFANGRPSKLTEAQWERACDMRRNGIAWAAIDRAFGVRENTCRSHFKYRGWLDARGRVTADAPTARRQDAWMARWEREVQRLEASGLDRETAEERASAAMARRISA